MNSSHPDRSREILKRIREGYPADAKLVNYVSELEASLDVNEQLFEEQSQQLREFEAAYEKLTAPANRVGTLASLLDDETASIILGETEYVVLIDPKLEDRTLLKRGARVRLNEAYAIVGVAESLTGGATMKIAEIFEDGRIRVGGDAGTTGSRLIVRGAELAETKLEAGDQVRLDASGTMAIEHFVAEDTQEFFVEEVPDTPWSAVGGQEEAIELIRKSLELPMLHPELFSEFQKKPVKGILLYGPPGCGKTLIGKAVAHNLAKDYSERAGREVKECFLSISGPKILNMWLGESERMVRDIFATARKKAKEGFIVVVFIDEAESLLRTRSSGRWLNISNTIVPQFCAEMDGILGMENVVVILTSNRPDYIDPAILRPERIDRKIKINRPNQDAARNILEIYLSPQLPMDPDLIQEMDGEPSCARKALIELAIQQLWKESSETEFLSVQMKNGSNQTLYHHNLLSGALLKSIVDRAKDTAIDRALANPAAPRGLTKDDIVFAINAEFRENEIFPKTDHLEDWLKLLDFEPENVASILPARDKRRSPAFEKSVI